MKKTLMLSGIGAALLFLAFAANTAQAGVATYVGKSTCYLFKQGKLASKEQCQVYVEEGANSAYPMYGFENYSVKMPKAGIMHVINSSSCESENDCEHEHTINDKEATSHARYSSKGYKTVSWERVDKLPRSVRVKLLSCDATLDGKLEICKTEVSNTKMSDAPKWTGRP